MEWFRMELFNYALGTSYLSQVPRLEELTTFPKHWKLNLKKKKKQKYMK